MRVLVLDGHPAMRLGLKGLLGVAGDIWVIGETGDGEEALSLARELRPDLVILGLNLIGSTDGVAVCRRLKALEPPPRVLVYASYDFSDGISSCLLAGADGYLHKRAGCEELLGAVRRTAAGERVWSVGAREAASRGFVTQASARLTPKEREILVLMLCHCSNSEMSERLHLSCETVRTHVRSVLRKLGVRNRKDLLRSHGSHTVNL